MLFYFFTYPWMITLLPGHMKIFYILLCTFWNVLNLSIARYFLVTLRFSIWNTSIEYPASQRKKHNKYVLIVCLSTSLLYFIIFLSLTLHCFDGYVHFAGVCMHGVCSVCGLDLLSCQWNRQHSEGKNCIWIQHLPVLLFLPKKCRWIFEYFLYVFCIQWAFSWMKYKKITRKECSERNIFNLR